MGEGVPDPGGKGPLGGRRILVTRAEEQGGGLREELEALGAEVLWIPAIRTVAVSLGPDEAAILGNLSAFAWVAFTSPNGVRFFFEALAAAGGSLPEGVRVAAVGKGTEEALARGGIRVHLLPPRATGACLGETLREASDPVPILLPRGRKGREELGEVLRGAGWAVTELTLYDTVAPEISEEQLAALARGVDAALFASPSAVTNLWDALSEEARAALAKAKLLPIGPTTAEALVRLGLEPAAVPEEYNLPGLLAVLLRLFPSR